MSIDENLLRDITADALTGVTMENSHVDYSIPENAMAYAGMKKFAKELPPGYVVDFPHNGADEPSSEQTARARANASERAQGVESRYSQDQPRGDDGRFSEGNGINERLANAGAVNVAAMRSQDLKSPDGGFTLNPINGQIPKGLGDGQGNGPYAVALGKNFNDQFKASVDMFQSNANGHSSAGDRIAQFIRDNARQLGEPNMWLGGWHDPATGIVHLDVTEVLPKGSLGQATALGAERNQIAITDLSTFESIKTGGTGD